MEEMLLIHVLKVLNVNLKSSYFPAS